MEVVAGSDGELIGAARDLGAGARVLPFPSVLARLGDAGAGGPAGAQMYPATALMRTVLAAPSTALYALRLRRMLRAAAPSVIHSNGLKMHLIASWAAPRGVPVLWHIHDYVSARPVMMPLLRAHARRCAVAVANSTSVAEDLRAACGGRFPIFPIHYAIDLERFSPFGPVIDLDEAAGLDPPSTPVVRVGLVATMARWKGHQVFLRALARLPQDVAVRGYVIGGPLYATRGSQYEVDELRRMAKELGLEGRVGFTGFIGDAAGVMRALDIVVHASTEAEPFGLVIAEAMGCGRAVIASPLGGAAELISPGIDALVHEPGSAASLAARIEELARDPARRAALGARAVESARERFSLARLARQIAPVYERIAKAAERCESSI